MGKFAEYESYDGLGLAELVGQGKCQYYDLPNMHLRDIRNLLLLRAKRLS